MASQSFVEADFVPWLASREVDLSCFSKAAESLGYGPLFIWLDDVSRSYFGSCGGESWRLLLAHLLSICPDCRFTFNSVTRTLIKSMLVETRRWYQEPLCVSKLATPSYALEYSLATSVIEVLLHKLSKHILFFFLIQPQPWVSLRSTS